MIVDKFETPTDLHYSQTVQRLYRLHVQFETPTNLHYSQTPSPTWGYGRKFETPTDLHYSQTSNLKYRHAICERTYIHSTAYKLLKAK